MTERILNDRYALEQRVGEGGMAITYRALDLSLNRTVAIKLLREQYSADQVYVERFRREAQAAARLSHDNIAGVYDTGSANGSYYIVMEFIEGTDLKQRLRREGPLPILNALEIARQVAAALDAAHRGGLVHRDIKPHNILLNQDGKVKVADFGIAKHTSEGEDTGVIMGSVHYISPEQARGEVTTPASDLYSLGTVLFEMLTGRTLFEADNAMAVAHKQIYDRPPLPRTLRPDIPPAVESVVLRCLEKDPRARYQSAAELQAVLAQLCNQLAQEQTIIITPPVAPSMDATMVYRPPVAQPAPAHPRTPDYPHANQPADPYSTNAGRQTPSPGNVGESNWLTGMLFIVLAIGLGIAAYFVLSPHTQPNHDLPLGLTVPSVLGQDQATAQNTLTAAGFLVNVQPGNDPATPAGQVCSQDPAANASAKKGETVTIYVNPIATPVASPVTMPFVLGMTYDDAVKDIRAAGFSGKIVQKTQESPSPDTPSGTIFSSDPAANTVTANTTVVKLFVTPPQTVIETCDMGTAPDTGSDLVHVRLMLENPANSPQKVLWEGDLKPGDKIPIQTVKRKPDDRIHIVLQAMKSGADPKTSLIDYSDQYFPKSTGAGQ